MSNPKKIAVLLLALLVATIVVSFVVGSVINMIVPPSQASFGDEIVEDIGKDGVLIATLDDCLKLEEKAISDGDFKTHLGQELSWRNARNISYVDAYGNHGYMIVWKDAPDNYPSISDDSVIRYISDSLDSMKGECFLVHFPEENAVYGIIINTDEIACPESVLLYGILGLNQSDFPPTYQQTSSSYSTGGSNHYHTVIPDRDTLSRTDPGAYYDHYEYGDNYDIDDYLESEGYD